MDIVDLQLHEPGPMLAWDEAGPETRRAVLTESLLQMTDAVGVDAVVLHPMEDLDWALQLAQDEPRRWTAIPVITGSELMPEVSIPIDAFDLEERIAEAAQTAGVGGVRLLPSPGYFPEEHERFLAGGYDRALTACQAQGLPVLVLLSGRAETLGPVAARFPDVQFVLDHLGLPQGPGEPHEGSPWDQLPQVLGLAQYENVAVKVCHPIALSEEPWPHADVWPHVERLLEAFGAGRLAWGSDIGRFRGRFGFNLRLPVHGGHTYLASLAFFLHNDQLSPAEKEQILGATARRVVRWPAA